MGEASVQSRRSGEPRESTDFRIACPPAVVYHTLGRHAVLDYFPERWSRQRNLFRFTPQPPLPMGRLSTIRTDPNRADARRIDAFSPAIHRRPCRARLTM